ncbi:centrosomal AT-AC splicing factor-like isoform X2 [Dreissena polymorpha]|uniref:centrosomal AT-AC splicing factor-like isoform X2 n=1 Tax=Dreissena polymorpha TaxID=45954 RepID=UPI002264F771|nr:centrosomal AT-AC splicing factor-like isoform X2 [Dreissena polymorpha]
MEQNCIVHAKSTLFSPDVQDAGFESGAKFWCYFCQIEASKHVVSEDCTVLGSGLLHHISSDEHRASMDQFFWDNLVKKERRPKFILTPADLTIFEKSSFLAVKKYQKAKTEEIKQLAATLSASEHLRCQRLTESMQAEQGTSNVNQSHFATSVGNQSAWDSSQSVTQKPKRTIMAHAEGLACVSQAGPPGEGNVHSGALPPWLQTESDGLRTEIGPTAADFTKHLEQKKKAKLPAGRVGANFDHSDSVSHDWLPSFGRVWSKGRRLQSKQHFEKEWKKGGGSLNKKYSSTITSIVKDNSDEHLPLNTSQKPASAVTSCGGIVPYKRKLEPAASKINTDWSGSGQYTNQMFPYRTSAASTANQNAGYKNVTDFNAVNRSALGDSVLTETRIESSSNFITDSTAVPYKRKRIREDNPASVHLIQTPILSLDPHTITK